MIQPTAEHTVPGTNVEISIIPIYGTDLYAVFRIDGTMAPDPNHPAPAKLVPCAYRERLTETVARTYANTLWKDTVRARDRAAK